jgi:hypothetical protein
MIAPFEYLHREGAKGRKVTPSFFFYSCAPLRLLRGLAAKIFGSG